MEEVKTKYRNLTIAFHDYKTAYNKVLYDWMLRVYSWMGLPVNVISLLRQLMRYWKIQLEIWNEEEKKVSRWIDIMFSFLPGDNYLPVGFCLSEVVPIDKILPNRRKSTKTVTRS